MEFILFLCVEIDSRGCLQGVRFTFYITELPFEPQSRQAIRQEYIHFFIVQADRRNW